MTDQQDLLFKLFQALATRNQSLALQLFREEPELARLPMSNGATRQQSTDYFFDEISHYAYAGDTALHMAAAAHQPDIAKELITRGANVRARNRRGAEPLHYAADGGPDSPTWNPAAQAAIVELLVKAGADPNSLDKSGVAPLHRAVRTRCTPAVETLIGNGADLFMRNKSGSSPLHLAVQDTGRSGAGSTASREEQAKIIRLLLSYGASPSDRDLAGRTVEDSARADWIRAILAAP